MSIEIKIPTIGESISEVTLAAWHKADGDFVEEGEILCDIESDKATIELPADSSGVLKITAEEGADLTIGAVIGTIQPGEGSSSKAAPSAAKESSSSPPPTPSTTSETSTGGHPSPAAKKIMDERGIDANSVAGTGKDGRITKADALAANTAPTKSASTPTAKAETETTGKTSAPTFSGSRDVNREKMTRLRKTIAKRLTEAKNSTAMLTTFNEVDMYELMELRKKYKDNFLDTHGVKLGFMSFFTKACCIAMEKHPLVNAQIDGEELVTPGYVDMGIAVSSDKGLVVPVVRNAESLSLAQIETEILRLAKKARDGKITVDEMSGGTFTITNGGVFGSMLSTPILNIPQSAILGMHNIVERPWVVSGEIKIRPIMYLALSYDHRVIDGKDSVGFLKTVKELLEDPARMLLGV